MFEFIAQFIGELLIQGLMEIGFRSLADVFKKKRNPIFSAIGCILWGAIAGGISLAVFPASFIARSDLKLLNLLTPVLVGALMVLLGRLRARKAGISWNWIAWLRLPVSPYDFTGPFLMGNMNGVRHENDVL